MRLGIFAYADTAAVPWGGFFEVPFLGGDNYSPVQAVRYRRILIKIYHQLTRAHKPERLVLGRSCVLVACITSSSTALLGLESPSKQALWGL